MLGQVHVRLQGQQSLENCAGNISPITNQEQNFGYFFTFDSRFITITVTNMKKIWYT